LPTPRGGFYNIVAKAGDIYVIGGKNEAGEASPANEVYDISTNEWEQEVPMPHPRGEMGVAAVNNRIFTIGGGVPAFGTGQSNVEVYVPRS
jgi:hypothetical protein